MTVVLGRTTLPDKYHWRRSSIGRSSGMYLIRLDSASIWTRQERRREGNWQQGRGNLCFRRKWDLRDSYSHPPLPILPPPERFLEPLRSAYGRFPNRAIYRSLSRGWECKSYLYCISRDQVNISSSHSYPRFVRNLLSGNHWNPLAELYCFPALSSCLVPHPSRSVPFHVSLSFKYLNYKYLSMSRNSSFWPKRATESRRCNLTAILSLLDDRLLRFIEIHDRASGKLELKQIPFLRWYRVFYYSSGCIGG